jgi:hypothetical protein
MHSRTLLGTASLVVVAVAAWSYAAHAADTVSGKWDVTLAGSITTSCTADVRRQGKNLTGSVVCPEVGMRIPIKGEISGDSAVNTAGGDLGWTATMSGTTASGTYQGSIGAGSWTAERVP